MRDFIPNISIRAILDPKLSSRDGRFDFELAKRVRGHYGKL